MRPRTGPHEQIATPPAVEELPSPRRPWLQSGRPGQWGDVELTAKHLYGGAFVVHTLGSLGLLLAWFEPDPLQPLLHFIVALPWLLGPASILAGLVWDQARRARGWPAWSLRCLQDRRTLLLALSLLLPFAAAVHWLWWGRRVLARDYTEG